MKPKCWDTCCKMCRHRSGLTGCLAGYGHQLSCPRRVRNASRCFDREQPVCAEFKRDKRVKKLRWKEVK